ncbi:MAG: hypothetical protein JOZ54_20670 [Acidobacteria bacterium]|nr:hypothetical protein [Acidobacteriota bacterium]
MKKARIFARFALLLTVLSIGMAIPAMADTGLPCYDMWRGCLAGGGGENYCEGVWLGCMEKTYGTLEVAN